MNTFKVLIILLLLLGIMLFIEKQYISPLQKTQGETLGVEKSPSITSKNPPSPTMTPTSTLAPTIIESAPSLTSILTPTPPPINIQNNTSSFIYPNSNQIGQDGNAITLESNDSANIITDWYKEKIKSIGMKATSFVQTSTNGNILNKLVGAKSNEKVEVEIKKKANESMVKIKISASI